MLYTFLPLAAYLVLLMVLGYRANKQNQQTAYDFFVASGSLNWQHIAMTYFASWVSTFALLGSPGSFFSSGVSWWFVVMTFNAAAPLFAWWLYKKIYEAGKNGEHVTLSDYFAHRYSSRTINFTVALISVAALIPYCLIQFVGIGKVFATASGETLSYELGIVLIAIVTALYAILGGVRAVVWTDVFQGFLVVGVAVLAAGAAIYSSGGIGSGIQAAYVRAPELFRIERSNFGAPLTLAIIWFSGFIVMPHTWQRSYMALDLKELSRGLSAFSILLFVVIASTAILGFCAIGLMPDLLDSDKVVPEFFSRYLPWASPLLVLAVFAAGMSTIDSQLLTASSVIVNDLSREHSTIRNNPIASKLIVLLLIVLIAALALTPAAHQGIVVVASKGISIVFLVMLPLVASILWERTAATAVAVSLVGGGSLWILLELELLRVPNPYGFGTSLMILPFQLIALLGLSSLPYLLIQVRPKFAKY